MNKRVVTAYGSREQIAKLRAGKIPMAFTGEIMRCVVCGATERSGLDKQTDWRALDLDGVRHYACPKEFPHDGASADDFARAYTKVITCAILEGIK